MGKSSQTTASSPALPVRAARKTKHKKKSHYPKSKFNTESVQKRTEDHGLVELLSTICQSEEDALKLVFGKNEGLNMKDIENKQALHDILLSVLHNLPQQVREGLNDQEEKFLPELSQEEKHEITRKQQQLESLDRHEERLNAYLQNIVRFREDHGLWLGNAPPTKTPSTTSEHVETTAQRYMSILSSIESSCDQILTLSDSCKKDMQTSRQIQEKLYDEYNTLRSMVAPTDTHSQTQIPQDPKDLLRCLPKLFTMK